MKIRKELITVEEVVLLETDWDGDSKFRLVEEETDYCNNYLSLEDVADYVTRQGIKSGFYRLEIKLIEVID
jgi:hypothetical protein